MYFHSKIYMISSNQFATHMLCYDGTGMICLVPARHV